MANDLVIIGDEQAKFGTEGLKTVQAAGKYVAEVLGTLPHDLVGLWGGDWIRVKRAENLKVTIEQAKKRLRDKGIEPETVSLAIGVPLLEAASEESRDDLTELWVRLLATAMDPKRKAQVRRRFIDTLKQFDPLDALVFLVLDETQIRGVLQPSTRAYLAHKLVHSEADIELSMLNLLRLECVFDPEIPSGRSAVPHTISNVLLSTYGRQMLLALKN